MGERTPGEKTKTLDEKVKAILEPKEASATTRTATPPADKVKELINKRLEELTAAFEAETNEAKKEAIRSQIKVVDNMRKVQGKASTASEPL